MWRSLFVLGSMFAMSACSVSDRAEVARDGDVVVFAEQIQPILSAHCGYLGCHGREGMPLTIYGVDYLRLRDPDGIVDSTRPALDERTLTPAEVDHNRHALSARIGRDTPAEDRERLLRRLIPPASGGIRHAGVVVYDDPGDPEIERLRQFLETVQ